MLAILYRAVAWAVLPSTAHLGHHALPGAGHRHVVARLVGRGYGAMHSVGWQCINCIPRCIVWLSAEISRDLARALN